MWKLQVKVVVGAKVLVEHVRTRIYRRLNARLNRID